MISNYIKVSCDREGCDTWTVMGGKKSGVKKILARMGWVKMKCGDTFCSRECYDKNRIGKRKPHF